MPIILWLSLQRVKENLYDYQNDLMPLVILVIKYIKGDDDLEEKEAQDTS